MLAIHESNHFVLIFGPIAKFLDIIPDTFKVRVEQMSTILGDSNARFFIYVVIAVSSNMVSAFNDKGRLVPNIGISFGNYSS